MKFLRSMSPTLTDHDQNPLTNRTLPPMSSISQLEMKNINGSLRERENSTDSLYDHLGITSAVNATGNGRGVENQITMIELANKAATDGNEIDGTDRLVIDGEDTNSDLFSSDDGGDVDVVYGASSNVAAASEGDFDGEVVTGAGSIVTR